MGRGYRCHIEAFRTSLDHLMHDVVGGEVVIYVSMR